MQVKIHESKKNLERNSHQFEFVTTKKIFFFINLIFLLPKHRYNIYEQEKTLPS